MIALGAERQLVLQHHHVADIIGDAARHGGDDDAVRPVEEHDRDDRLQNQHRR